MKNLSRITGTLAFWLLWPALWFYLRNTVRSRLIVIHDQNILVVKGWLSTDNWTAPGGGVKKNENTLEAAQRELLEETGIAIDVNQLQSLGSMQGFEHGFKYTCLVFKVVLENQPEPKRQRGEIREVAWLSAKELNEQKISTDLAIMLARWSV